MSRTKIFIVSHKNIELPRLEGYQVISPRAQNTNIKDAIYDDCGENISSKNPNYSELSSLYCIWKNQLNSGHDYYGLCHYRRFFGIIRPFLKPEILTVDQADKFLNRYDIILPQRIWFDSMSVRTQLVRTSVDKENYLQIRRVVAQIYPDYLQDYDTIMRGNILSICNLFVTDKMHFEQYCEWLFNLLFEIEKRVVINPQNEYRKRIFGFIGERLLNVWVLHNHLRVKYLPIINPSDIKKGHNLLRPFKYNYSLYKSQKQYKKDKIYLSDDLD